MAVEIPCRACGYPHDNFKHWQPHALPEGDPATLLLHTYEPDPESLEAVAVELARWLRALRQLGPYDEEGEDDSARWVDGDYQGSTEAEGKWFLTERSVVEGLADRALASAKRRGLL